MSGDLQRARRALERFKLFGDASELATALEEVITVLENVDRRSPRLIGTDQTFVGKSPLGGVKPVVSATGAQPYDVPLPLEFK